LNNLFDLSVQKEFNAICGLSQKEVKENFPKELEIYDLEKIRTWYNGYKWHYKGETVYNPFSLLNFFSSGDFRNYWYSTGTPTFLIELCRSQKFYAIDKVNLSQTAMDNFNIDKLQIYPILFQTGYLTISDYDEILNLYELDYPNMEVRASYLEGLLEAFSYNSEPLAPQTMQQLLRAVNAKNSNDLTKAINNAFAYIPYDLWQKENEHFYHAIIHLLFSLLGVYIHREVHTKDGRADAIINIDEGIFCLEFKLDKTAQEAVQQVKDKGYLDAYRHLDKPCNIIGINFSSKDKAVQELLFLED